MVVAPLITKKRKKNKEPKHNPSKKCRFFIATVNEVNNRTVQENCEKVRQRKGKKVDLITANCGHKIMHSLKILYNRMRIYD